MTGASGAGKSSLLSMIYLARRPSGGKIHLFERDVATLSRQERASMRRKIGVVFQDFRLLDHLTALENVALPLKISGQRDEKVRHHVAKLLAWVGFDPVPQILFNSFATTLGMVHILIPYMILSIYAAMQKIDPNHLRAAASLGATPFQGFRTVFLPLSMPGVVNGCTLVFIICLGFYVTPVLLGGPRDQMIAGLIGEQIEELLEWGFASAMAVVLLATTMALLAVYNRLVGLDKLWG